MDTKVFLLPKEGDQLGHEGCWEMWSYDPHDAYRCEKPAVIKVQGVPFCAEHAKKRAAELAKEAAAEINTAIIKETISARILGLLR